MGTVPRDMLASPDFDYENHSSSHSEPQLLEVRDASDLRRKIGGDSKATDRRKRNGESAKRSRDKRKMRITEMEENYEQLEEGHKRLLEENRKFRRRCLHPPFRTTTGFYLRRLSNSFEESKTH